jgi:thymidylate kinase
VIVEFIGASGSGKTSLARKVAHALEETDDAVMASDLVLRRLHLEEVTGPTARNMVADLNAVVEMLRLKAEQRTFLAYALRMLNRHRPRSFLTLNYVRSVVRRIGMDGIARRRGNHMVVLADEGIVLVAYLLFVYGNTGLHEDDLAEFAEIAPLPDRVVHVKAPLESLVDRTLARPDPPRELRARDRETVTRFLGSAADMFAGLVTTPQLRDRVLEVENLGDAAEQQALAVKIADSIRTLRQPAGIASPRAMADSHKEV